MFITNDQSADNNFWDTIPPYLGNLVSYLDNPSVLSTIQAKDTSGNLLNATVQITQSNNLVHNAATNSASFAYDETSGWPFSFNAQYIPNYTFCSWSDGVNTYSNPMQYHLLRVRPTLQPILVLPAPKRNTAKNEKI